MASYRLSKHALADLDRLYEHGILAFGLRQADIYYDGLITHFQDLAEVIIRVLGRENSDAAL